MGSLRRRVGDTGTRVLANRWAVPSGCGGGVGGGGGRDARIIRHGGGPGVSGSARDRAPAGDGPLGGGGGGDVPDDQDTDEEVDLARDDVEGIQQLYGSNPNFKGVAPSTTGSSPEMETSDAGGAGGGGRWGGGGWW
uniref:Uncharacterized protein n=1 Tax=Ananas comosus var. bracteatus TaxID=296719 RepID=A0A6V7P7I2_ANACO|nr:unnamed protein product [Ananas comosus var. bracteatus]